ncbi:YbaN family protein [Motilimonas pumila]|uniref:Inner membrane protein n=1 Tax=Motilimonas pumila TaxID=2303987 RepID=A0A418YCR5_9GAMM|nr:YbaN family protein [Motilimonas pumila]RJG42281.1 DUF454 domain-containing protein [Motilimonas pumila]
MKRAFYFCIGLLSLGLGILGIPLPVLPTTPFVLLAAFCFAKSSPRFHQYLLTHPWFGNMIQDWQQHRRLARKTKYKAIIMMTLTFAISVYWVPLWAVKIGLIVCYFILATYIWRLKER